MTDSQLSAGPDSLLPSTVRHGGLVGWGVLLIVLGTLLCLSVVTEIFASAAAMEEHMLQPPTDVVRQRTVPSHDADVDAVLIIGMVVAGAAGTGLLWTGIASCVARRWVRPIVMIFSMLTLIVVLLGVVANLLSLPELLKRVDETTLTRHRGPTSGAVLSIECLQLAVVLGVGVVLPWIIFRFYASAQTRQALKILDARPSWTDRCPIPILGWAIFVGLMGISMLLNLFHPAVPAFTVVVMGSGAIIAGSIIGVALLWSALLCYRMDRLGWMVSLFILAILRISTATYYWTGGEPADILQAAFWHEHQNVVPHWVIAVMSTVEACALIGYGVFVERYFKAKYQVGLISSGSAA
jgi:hypothetical protein